MSGPIDLAKYFEAKVPLDEAAQQQAATQLSPYRLANVAQHSFDNQRPTYVMHLDSQNVGENLWKIAIACSDNVAKLYDYNSLTGQLTFTHQLRQHTDNINDIQFVPELPFMVCTASEDGTAYLWDSRSGEVKQRFKVRGPLTSCTATATTFAASCDQDIYLWDIRSGVQKQVISDFQSSTILRVRFHPVIPSRLFSASDDGTIMQFDLTIELSSSTRHKGGQARCSRKHKWIFAPGLPFHGMHRVRRWHRIYAQAKGSKARTFERRTEM